MALSQRIAFWLGSRSLGLLTRVIPSLGKPISWTLFCRSPKPANPNAEDQYFLDSHGQPEVIEVLDHKVRVYAMNPPGETRMRVLLLHGWGSRSTVMLGIGKQLMQQGASVVYFDGPGSGLTGSRRSILPHMQAAVEKIQHEKGPFDVMVGHSFGGLVAAHTIAQGSVSTCRVLVTVGSPNSFEEMVRRLIVQWGQPKWMLEYFDRRVHAITGLQLQDYGVAVSLNRLTPDSLAYLCIHDVGDKEVPISDAQEIERALSFVQMDTTTGLGHNRILRDEGVQKRIVAFVESTLYGDVPIGVAAATKPAPRA